MGGIGALYALDHTVVPARAQLAVHAGAAGAVVGAALAAGATFEELGLGRSKLGRGLLHGLAAGSVIAGVVAAGAAIPATRGAYHDERVEGLSAGAALWRGLVEIPVGTALYEEVLFRGVLLGLASKRMPLPAAVALTSVAFGFWHVVPALRNQQAHPLTRDRHEAVVVAATVANTAVLGALLAIQRLHTGSLAAPVLTHAASNATSFLAAALVTSRSGQSRRAAPPAAS